MTRHHDIQHRSHRDIVIPRCASRSAARALRLEDDMDDDVDEDDEFEEEDEDGDEDDDEDVPETWQVQASVGAGTRRSAKMRVLS